MPVKDYEAEIADRILSSVDVHNVCRNSKYTWGEQSAVSNNLYHALRKAAANYRPMSHCCGIMEIHGWSNLVEISKERFVEGIEYIIRCYNLKNADEECGKYVQVSIITTPDCVDNGDDYDQDNKKEFSTWLSGLGFEEKASFYNSSGGNHVLVMGAVVDRDFAHTLKEKGIINV